MKLSIEAKVAAAVALAFAVLSIGAIAQEQSERGTNSANSPTLTYASLGGSREYMPAP